jgi:hypothetical protein
VHAPDALPFSLQQQPSPSPAGLTKLPYHRLLLRVRGYYRWDLPYGQKTDLAPNWGPGEPPVRAGAERGKCGYPNCILPEKHSGAHELVAIEGKRRREPTKKLNDLGA